MILVIDNYDSFTFNLVHGLAAASPDEDVRVVRCDRIDARTAAKMEPTHIVISPGPCTPAEAGLSVDVIHSLAGRVPILGVCLGHQCIAAAFGMAVVRADEPVHGHTGVVRHDGRGLFDGIHDRCVAARYHSLIVDESTVGHGWEVSAWMDGRDPGRRLIMGLRRRWDRPGLAPLDGIQFHPESFLTEDGPRILRNFMRSEPTSEAGARGISPTTLGP
ncbi:MAG: aminodeoxychorismate/anthranilate synthase component II [Phycisphaeraceae bacterium]|nr:aminodeoxychorismate/anthranilate synthase component II [Phycisphaeraceae bacterium]